MNARKVCLGLAVVFALTVGVAKAQPEVEWERTYGGEHEEKANSIIETADGGFALAGATYSFGAGIVDFYLARTNADGDSLWSRTFGGGNYEVCNSIIQTADGGFAMAGWTYSLNAGGVDFWLVRTNANGDSLWSRRFGGEEDDYCFSLIQTADGGFALAGDTRSFGTGNGGSQDFWLVRTNADGDSLWSQTYGKSEESDYCHSLIQMADGGFALSGWTQSMDFLLVRTNADGDSLWSRTFSGGNYEACYSLIQAADGGFALAGYTESLGAGSADFWLVRTNADGDSLWSRTFGGESWEVCHSLVQTADGGFVLAGYTTSFGAGSSDFWLMRTNSDGDSLWSSTFGGEGDDYCYSMALTSDGGFALAGYTNSFGAGSNDIWLVKTTPDPVSVRESQVIAPFALHLAQPYPNPFNGAVTIPFGLDKSATTRLEIFDPLGRRVAELIPTGLVNGPYAGGKHSVVWDANGMPAGQYIVRLEAGNQQLSQRLSLVK